MKFTEDQTRNGIDREAVSEDDIFKVGEKSFIRITDPEAIELMEMVRRLPEAKGKSDIEIVKMALKDCIRSIN